MGGPELRGPDGRTGADPRARGDETGLLELLEPVALDAVRLSAAAAARWSGRGDGKAADGAATNAMREVLEQAFPRGTVVTGEGAKDDAPMLEPGEQLGGEGPLYDIAVDPLECTDLCAAGLGGSLTTIGVAAHGTLYQPGAAYYMDKLVVGAAARDALDLEAGPLENARRIARALGIALDELRVVVLDKPRHGELVRDLRAAGARVSTPPAGDVAGALAAVLADGDADVLMGIGGTPEGVMTACAVRALGGGMQARLAPQRDDEARALADAGVDLDLILSLEDLAAGPTLFAAAAVTGGLVPAPETEGENLRVHTILVAAGEVSRASAVVQKSPHPEN